jgi:feruloyl esterase
MLSKMDSKKAADSVRLFMIPGMGHCGGGTGACSVDMLSVIDRWVSDGKAPDKITAFSPSGQEAMTRPVCPYPQVPVYKGSGNTNNAASFECR